MPVTQNGPPPTPHPLHTTVRTALDEASLICGKALGAISREPDLETALTAVTELSVVLQELVAVTAMSRRAVIVRIWETGALSLSGLAARLGVSKTRAAQLITVARTREPPRH